MQKSALILVLVLVLAILLIALALVWSLFFVKRQKSNQQLYNIAMGNIDVEEESKDEEDSDNQETDKASGSEEEVKGGFDSHQVSMTILYQNIEQKMRANAPYTDPNFDLATLATLVGSNRTYVSKAINSCSTLNFSSWLAKYRIEMAVQMLSADPSISLTDLSEMIGYDNRSRFHRHFVAVVGLTPAEFRKQQAAGNMK